MSEYQLQDRVLHSAAVAFAFVGDGIVKIQQEVPWSLCTGGVEAKLEALVNGTDPLDSTAWTIKKLAETSASRGQLIQAIRLLGHCPWSTTSVEQQHGSCGTIHRHHPDYSLETLMVRAGFHSMRKLIDDEAGSSNEVKKLEAQVDRLFRKVPQRVGARLIFFKDLCTGLADRSHARGRPLAPGTLKQACKVHGRSWVALAPWKKAHWEEQAAIHIAKQQASVSKQIGTVKVTLLKAYEDEQLLKQQSKDTQLTFFYLQAYRGRQEAVVSSV